MKIKENLRKTKGITLVALVVTIIVLIILAGVSISLVLGENGIITKSKYAKQETLNGQVEEQEKLNEAVEYIEALGGNEEKKEISSTLKGLKVGDYIKYNTGVNGVGEIMCRVLYEAESEYGLQIISNADIAQVELGGTGWEAGRDSYNGAISKLNNKAEEYINKNYVIDARCIGSLPTVDDVGNFIQKDLGTETTRNLWFKPNGWTSTDSGCKDTDENYKKDVEVIQNIGMNYYGWLASRYVNEHMEGYEFRIRFKDASITSVPSLGICEIYAGTPQGSTLTTKSIRACFSVRTDIEVIGGNGKSESTAYIL